MSPFPEAIRQKEVERTNNCEVCGDFLPPDGYCEIHSATGMHLVVINNNGNTRYLITDPPSNLESLRNETVGLRVYPYKPGQLSDGVKLCPSCHDQIHESALIEAKRLYPWLKGNIVPPFVLRDVTLFFLERGKF